MKITQLPCSPQIGARIAWGYLSSLLAMLFGVVMMALCSQFMPALFCPAASDAVLDDALAVCTTAWGIITFVVGAVIALLIVGKLMKQDIWLWLGISGLALGLCINAQIADWWWLMLLLLAPAFGALISAQWVERGRPLWQQIALITLPLLATGGLVCWIMLG